MTIKELMQQDPREFFGLDDPRDIQQVRARATQFVRNSCAIR